MMKRRAYLDCNASEVLRASARAAFIAALDADGNPSSVHGEGRRARAVVEDAREAVAALLGARVSEVVFTSGASEANAAVAGAGWARIVLSAIEHHSVIAPARASGAEVVEVGALCNGEADAGAIAVAVLKSAAAAGSTLIALQLANNETGVLQPAAETAAFARGHGTFIHADAVQAVGRMTVDFAALGLDTMSLSSHKIGGPKGVGALLVRDGVSIPALIAGGGQERGRRAGTENVAAIAGFGAAAREVAGALADMQRIAALRDSLEREVERLTPDAIIIGAGATRLANTSCIALPGERAETLVIRLDLAGVAVSAGAACSSGKVASSHVLAAMGLPAEIAAGALRVSFGHASTEEDVAAFLRFWAGLAAERRQAGKTDEVSQRQAARHKVERVS